MGRSTELSRREREVAALVAEGMTNRQIAERLFIAERTAEGHVEQIRNKLGFSTRSQIAAWVGAGYDTPRPLRGGRRPSTVPRPLSSLVGRSNEIETVVAALGSARLVTITGLAGIGKTRLALEAAVRVEEGFGDGTWFVELDSVPDGASVAAAVAHGLKTRLVGGPVREDGLSEQLARRDALLVLDNCEHIVSACADFVLRILSRPGRVRILTTSREPLAIAGERVIALEPLSPRGEAMTLLAQRCADLGGTAWTEAEKALGAVICERLDGIPLAIELAAAQTPVLSLAGIVDKLDDRFEVLRSAGNAPTRRHQALETAIDWSYQLLRPDEQAAFRYLSTFRGGFELEAAEALLEVDGDRSSLDLVGSLIRKSMLVPRDEPTGERRYHMPETLRQFAEIRLDSSRESRLASERHASYFLELGQAAFARLRSPDSDIWVRRLDMERANLNAALAFLSSSQDQRFIDMVAALSRYWIRGRVQDGYLWTQRAMNSNHPKTKTDVDLLEGWAWLTWQSAKSGPAFDAIDSMLETALDTGNEAAAGRALNMTATFRNDLKLPVDPELWVRAEKHLRRAGEDWPLALLLNDFGYVETTQGKPESGLPKILEGLELARRAGDGWLIALVLDSAAWAYVAMNQPDRAMRSWVEGISTTVAVAHRWSLPNYLEGFARLSRLEGDAVRACKLLGAAAAVRGELGARPLENWTDYTRNDIELVRRELGDEKFDDAWRIGIELSAQEAVEFALEPVRSGTV